MHDAPIIDAPDRFREVFDHAGPGGYVVVARIGDPERDGDRPSEDSLGRIQGTDEQPEASLGRLLMLNAGTGQRTVLRVRAYRDGAKQAETKLVAMLTEPPSPAPVGAVLALPAPVVHTPPPNGGDYGAPGDLLLRPSPPAPPVPVSPPAPSIDEARGSDQEVRALQLGIAGVRLAAAEGVQALRAEVRLAMDRLDDRLDAFADRLSRLGDDTREAFRRVESKLSTSKSEVAEGRHRAEERVQRIEKQIAKAERNAQEVADAVVSNFRKHQRRLDDLDQAVSGLIDLVGDHLR